MKSENQELFYRVLAEHNRLDKPVELIIKLSHDKIDHSAQESVRQALEEYLPVGGNLDFFEYVPYASFRTTARNADALAEKLSQERLILSRSSVSVVDVDVSHTMFILDNFAEQRLRRLYKTDEPQTEPHEEFDDMWNLRNVEHYKAARDFGPELGDLVKVAIIDTGCDYRHPEIRDRFNPHLLGYNFVHNNSDPRDGNRHGTHVAGTIAGRKVGVAPYAKLHAVKVLSDEGSGSEADVMRGIEWCIRNEMDAANLSLGGPTATKAFEDVCNAARKYGVFLVAAAGNSYIGKNYPAAFESVISVAAVDREKKHAEFSNIDNTLDVSGPGVKVLSCVPGGGYERYSGTSMASPHACGVLTCGLSFYKPKRNAAALDDMRYVLREACDPCQGTGSSIIDSWLFGSGHVNAYNFIEDVIDKLLR